LYQYSAPRLGRYVSVGDNLSPGEALKKFQTLEQTLETGLIQLPDVTYPKEK
jgi:hypothetical protein